MPKYVSPVVALTTVHRCRARHPPVIPRVFRAALGTIKLALSRAAPVLALPTVHRCRAQLSVIPRVIRAAMGTIQLALPCAAHALPLRGVHLDL